MLIFIFLVFVLLFMNQTVSHIIFIEMLVFENLDTHTVLIYTHFRHGKPHKEFTVKSCCQKTELTKPLIKPRSARTTTDQVVTP